MSSINGAARLMKEASPTPTNLKEEDQHCIKKLGRKNYNCIDWTKKKTLKAGQCQNLHATYCDRPKIK